MQFVYEEDGLDGASTVKMSALNNFTQFEHDYFK